MEQAIRGCVFQNINELCQAVRTVLGVNKHRRVEKPGDRSPAQMRRERLRKAAWTSASIPPLPGGVVSDHAVSVEPGAVQNQAPSISRTNIPALFSELVAMPSTTR